MSSISTAPRTAVSPTAPSSNGWPRKPRSNYRGGGLRDNRGRGRVLELGVARAVIGSAAITQVDSVRAWLEHFGPERLILGLRHPPGRGGHAMRRPRMDGSGSPNCRCGARLRTTRIRGSSMCCAPMWPGRHIGRTERCSIQRSGPRHPQIQWQARAASATRAIFMLWQRGASSAISGKALLEGLIRRRACGHSCQTHNPLPRRARRTSRQRRPLPRPPVVGGIWNSRPLSR